MALTSWRLRTSLIAVLLATTLSTFLVLGIGLLVYRLPLIADASRDTARREATDIADLLEFNLGGIENQLRPTVAFLRTSHTPQQLQAHLDAIVGDGIVIQALYVVAAGGGIEAIGLPPPRQERRSDLLVGDFSAHALFLQARETGRVVWSDKYLSAMTGSFAVGIAIPADDKMVIGEISPPAIVDTVRAISRRADHPVLVVDSRGEWIADNSAGSETRLTNWAGHPTVKAALANQPSPDRSQFNGKPAHSGYAISPHLGWAFVVGVPAGLANPEILTTLYLVGGSFAAALIIALFITPFYANQMVRPLRQLAKRTHKLARGDFRSTAIDESRIHEFNELAGDMESMARAIQERQSEIALFARHLKESEHELENIFNASPAAMSVSDVQHNLSIIAVNEAWETQFGRTRDEIIGRNGAEIGLWADLADREIFLRQIHDSGTVRDMETWMLRADGSRILCKTAGRVIVSDDQKLLIMVQEDYTERRRIEQEIRDLNADLEARVRRRTDDLARANEELSETLNNLQVTRSELVRSENLAALGRLVAGVAHELNTPIGNGLMAATTLRDQLGEFREGLASGLRRNAFEAFLDCTATATDIMVRNLDRSAHLVNSFKRLAVDQTSAQRRQFLLAETIDATLAILQPTLKRTPYVIATEVPDDIALDSFPGALEQALTNLINNAVIHGFEGRGEGLIRIAARLLDAATVLIEFSDNGRGIPAAMQPHIFEPFFTSKLGQGGSGLGLHITHNAVVGILGGKLSFTSDDTCGTCFHITLPLTAPTSAPVAATP